MIKQLKGCDWTRNDCMFRCRRCGIAKPKKEFKGTDYPCLECRSKLRVKHED
jgi:hypothetical protein